MKLSDCELNFTALKNSTYTLKLQAVNLSGEGNMLA